MDRVPMTARRLLAMTEHGGDDDMWSSDFTDAELQVQMPIALRCLRTCACAATVQSGAARV